MKLTDLFVPFKVVQSTRKVQSELPDLSTDWINYMQSRNNQILSPDKTSQEPADEPENNEFYSFPQVPIIEQVEQPNIFTGKQVQNIQQKHSNRYQDYVNEYERYLQSHPEDADTQMQTILANIAAHESAYNSIVQNPTSSASGWFQFIDSTRQRYSNLNREQFKQDKQAQIAAATKLYKSIYNKYYKSSKWKPLIDKRGLTVEQVIYGGWFRPASLQNYLEKGYDTYADPQGTTLQKVWDSYNK